MGKVRGRRVRAGDLAVVVGAGRSGLAAARLLLREGANVRLLDRNSESLKTEPVVALRGQGVELIGGEHRPEHFSGAGFVVPSPGMPVAALGAYLNVEPPEIVGEMELAWRYLADEPVLAVTGTSGKTTTVSLAAAMLKAQGRTVFLGGNIGTPLSEYVLSASKVDVVAVEISSFQLQACSTFCPDVGVLLNISPNHQDYHKDMREYSEAKFRLFRCQGKDDLAVFGAGMKAMAARFELRARQVYAETTDRFAHSGLLGAHNRANQEAAWLACRYLGVSEASAARAVANFAPLPHRLEIVQENNGVLYVNDSKCTTVDSLRVALEAFDRPVRLLCGGKFKGGDLAALRELVGRRVAEVALFGASRELFESVWQNTVPLCWHATLQPAVRSLASRAERGDVVLLSPATSSFDLYSGYVERGNDFKRLVEGLS